MKGKFVLSFPFIDSFWWVSPPVKFISVKGSLIDDGIVISGMALVCQIRTGDHEWFPYDKQENHDQEVAPTEAFFVCLFFH